MSVFFARTRMPGVAAAGRHGHATGMWELFDPVMPFMYDVSDEDQVIFGAWSGKYTLLHRVLKCRTARLVTSSLGQMEMVPIEESWLAMDFKKLKKGTLDHILFGSRDAYEVYKDIEGVEYFPYPVDFVNPAGGTDFGGKEDAVGLFMRCMRKNHANQRAAVRLVQQERSCRLVTNEEGWLPVEAYRTALSRLKAVLFVSHCESFGYMAIDALQAGTHVIYSPCVRDALGLEGI